MFMVFESRLLITINLTINAAKIKAVLLSYHFIRDLVHLDKIEQCDRNKTSCNKI